MVNDPAHPYVEPVKPDTNKVTLKQQMAAGKVTVLKSGDDLLISVPHGTAQLSIYNLQGVLMMRRRIEGIAVVPVIHCVQNPFVVKIQAFLF